MESSFSYFITITESKEMSLRYNKEESQPYREIIKDLSNIIIKANNRVIHLLLMYQDIFGSKQKQEFY
jgi:hypothetical protein